MYVRSMKPYHKCSRYLFQFSYRISEDALKKSHLREIAMHIYCIEYDIIYPNVLANL